MQENARVHAALTIVHVVAGRGLDALEHLVGIADEACLLLPLEDLAGPLRVRAVAGLLKQPGGEIEEDGVGGRVLVVVAGVEGENLPSKATAAVLDVPSRHKLVEDVAGEVQPLGLILGRARKSVFSRSHGGQSPDALIIVAFARGLVPRQEVTVGANLVQQALRRHGVVSVVTRLSPVIDQGLKQGTRFPPYFESVCRALIQTEESRGLTVVWLREIAWNLARLVAVIVLHEPIRNRARAILDRSYLSS